MSIRLFCLCCLAGLLSSCQKVLEPQPITTGTVKISISNIVDGIPMALNTANYVNSFGEQYIITKFKYYISNISVGSTLASPVNGRYYLIDQSNPATLSFSFNAPEGSYNAISFLLGVDSARNVSGAQTGALDPLNDMFWTWNTGYIMAKMEGNSPQSPVVNNKVEYHIGGFSGVNNVLQPVSLVKPLSSVNSINVRAGKTSEVFIEADFDDWWQGTYDLKIADNPAITHPGPTAKSISNNYSRMFSIIGIINH